MKITFNNDVKILKKSENKVFIFFILISSIYLIVCNFLMGLNFPIPWVDETFFLPQALSFAKSNTLLAPELDSGRPIMWMQPGYMIAVGTYLKFFSFSLESIRHISGFFYWISLVLIAKVFCYKKSIVSYFVIFIVFMMPASLAASNIARMESMVLALGIAAFISATTQKYVLAISLILLCSLIHFNGIYFGLPIILAMVINRKMFILILSNTKKYEWIIFLLATFLFLKYIIYVYENMHWFQIDMDFQFSRKLTRPSFYNDLRSILIIIVFILTIASMAHAKRMSDVLKLALGFSMGLILIIGQEMWYRVFLNIGIGILIIIYIDLLKINIFKWVSAISCLALYIMLSGYSFAGMSPVIKQSNYLPVKVVGELESAILSLKLKNNNQMSVAFNNTGSDLLFLNFFKNNNINLIRIMPEVMVPTRTVDLCIYISTESDPAWIRDNWIDELPAPKYCKLGVLVYKSANTISLIAPDAYKEIYLKNSINE
jgi:hypothetical protein